MVGTLVNVGTVVCGAAVGVGVGRHLPARIHENVRHGLGLASGMVGTSMLAFPHAGLYPNIALVVACILVGGLVGELLRLEQRTERLGEWLKHRVRSSSPTFVEGFVTASMLFCVGAMTIVGSIEDGALGDPTILLTKAAMDGFAAVMLASSFGIGVGFSALTVLVIQGSLTLLAGQLDFLLLPDVIVQIRGTGGLLIVGVALSLLELRRLRLLNYTPSLVLVVVAQLLLR